jgi:cold shock CspA family protein
MQKGTVTVISPHGLGFISADRSGSEVWVRP